MKHRTLGVPWPSRGYVLWLCFQVSMVPRSLRAKGGLWRHWGLSGELLQLCDHRAIPKEKQRAKPHTKCKQLGHGRHPQSLGSHRGGLGCPSSSMASKLWLGLSIRHKRQVRTTPPQAGVQGWASQPCFFAHPRVLSRAYSPSLLQAPTGDGGPSSYGKPRHSLLLGLAQQGKREGEESLGATGRREAPG